MFGFVVLMVEREFDAQNRFSVSIFSEVQAFFVHGTKAYCWRSSHSEIVLMRGSVNLYTAA
jgi:hypothetical protein